MSMYDEKISENVSLSKVLDILIESEEPSDIIVNFLKMYDNDFKEIASRSMCIDRIFCSDWLRRCKSTEADYVLSHLEDIDQLNAMYCAWQCLMLAASKHEYDFLTKHSFKFIHNPENKKIQHPYSGYGYNDVKDIDLDFIMNGFSPALAFSSFNYDGLERFINGGVHSLFATRLFQLDCFNACSYLHKFIIIKNLCNLPDFISYKFAKQLLVADIEPEIKNEIVDSTIIDSILKHIDFDEDAEYFHMLKHAKDYPSIAIQMTLRGEDAISDGIIYMLCLKKWKVLSEMAELDEETLQRNFPIKDLIDYIKSCNHAASNKKTQRRHAR